MKYIIVCGPTCSGKTSLGVKLALRFDGEIIGADSRQVYKHINIGTAKPAPRELRGIKHHLIDFLELPEDFSAYKFAEMAKALLLEISEQSKTPIVVGGTGLYLKALTEGLFKSPDPDSEYRRELESISRKFGPEKLHKMLSKIDPDAAGRIKPGDRVRLIRALEVYKLTGKPISVLKKTGKYVKAADALWIGLSPPRKTLYQKINDRVDEMIKDGFEKEVLGLSPYIEIIRRKKMIGYVDLIEYLFDKKINRETAIQKIKQHHRNYAKRQLTWFRKVKQITWFDPFQPGYEEKVYSFCGDFFKKA